MASSGHHRSLAGHLLLAMPGIGDARFERATIAMCVHQPEGALGVGIGTLLPMLRMHELLEQVGIAPGAAPDCPIHLGGPVDQQRGFVLHSLDWRGEDTAVAGDSFAFTTTLDILRAIAAGEGPDRWLIALGYAGWGMGQLEGELAGHGWFQTSARETILFETPTGERWTRAFADAGIDSRLLASTPGRA